MYSQNSKPRLLNWMFKMGKISLVLSVLSLRENTTTYSDKIQIKYSEILQCIYIEVKSKIYLFKFEFFRIIWMNLGVLSVILKSLKQE